MNELQAKISRSIGLLRVGQWVWGVREVEDGIRALRAAMEYTIVVAALGHAGLAVWRAERQMACCSTG